MAGTSPAMTMSGPNQTNFVNALDRLYDKGLIDDPANKAKSVVFTDEGLERAEQLFRAMFTKTGSSSSRS
jgi:hypothetical protein